VEGNVTHLAKEIDDLLMKLGYDTKDEHFRDTSERWIRAVSEFKARTQDELDSLFTDFESVYGGMVVIGPVQFSSLCPHHLLAYQGEAYVGYLPDGRIVGISKIARLIEFFTHQIITQEEATLRISEAIENKMKTNGCAVILRASHTCMCARGARALGSTTTTSVVKGRFLANEHGARDEFYRLIQIGA
jgi:GTP cyclohydrolase I